MRNIVLLAIAAPFTLALDDPAVKFRGSKPNIIWLFADDFGW